MITRMLRWLFALSILIQSAYGFAVSTPLPTNVQTGTSSPPQPTVGLSLDRRASKSDLDVRGCGWVKSKLYSDDSKYRVDSRAVIEIDELMIV